MGYDFSDNNNKIKKKKQETSVQVKTADMGWFKPSHRVAETDWQY